MSGAGGRTWKGFSRYILQPWCPDVTSPISYGSWYPARNFNTERQDAVVEERTWGPGDTYLVIPEFQVLKFQSGQRVRVIVEGF